MSPLQEPVQLGVMSFAHAHIHAYIQTIADFTDAAVVACWDDDRQRGEGQAARYGIDFVDSLDQFLSRRDIDAVFITSPTNRHAAHVAAAAQAGKHILLQKPMALTLADCDAIIQAVRQAGIKFSMCYQMRADPINQKIRQLVAEKAVGNLAVVRRRHAINALLNPQWAVAGNWHIDPIQNMGMFMDDASHAADWFYWLLGRPVSVMAEIDNVVTSIAPDDNGVAIYRFDKGAMGILLNSSTQLAAEATTEIYGDAGTIVQNYGDLPSTVPSAEATPLKLYRAGADDWEKFNFPFVPHGTRIQAVPRPLINYLKGDGMPLATAEDGRVCIEMILGAYQSAHEGRRVQFPRA